MTERPAVTSGVAGGRDAWVVDGFAPLPGDLIVLPQGDRATVQTVYLCAESNGLELVRWSWLVLDDGRLLEVAPRGCALYGPPTILPHGSGQFLELAAQDGALVRFEERVRAGVWEARPVRLTLGGQRWRLTSTGNVTARRLGPVPAGGWGQLRTSHPSSPGAASRPGSVLPSTLSYRAEGRGREDDLLTLPIAGQTPEERDVYFTLAGQTDGKADPNVLGLGVWMTDICLAFGRRLGDSPSAAGIKLADGAGRSS